MTSFLTQQLNEKGATSSAEKIYQPAQSRRQDFARPNSKKMLAWDAQTFFMKREPFLVCANILHEPRTIFFAQTFSGRRELFFVFVQTFYSRREVNLRWFAQTFSGRRKLLWFAQTFSGKPEPFWFAQTFQQMLEPLHPASTPASLNICCDGDSRAKGLCQLLVRQSATS